VTKIVYSTADSFAVLKFLADGTQAFEAEAGLTINEPGTLAVKATIESAVVELIKEGERKGIWDYRKPESAQAPVAPPPPQVVVIQPPTPAVVSEVKKTEAPKTEKMVFTANTKVYQRKSNLEGPLYGPFVVVSANTKATVKETDVKDVVEVETDSGVRGFVKQDRLQSL
jgi:hypothetical protein